MNPQITALIRSSLLFAGGFVVAKGWVDQETMISIVGGIMTIGAGTWSFWGHRKEGIIAAAAALPEVKKIVTTPEMAMTKMFMSDPTVVSAPDLTPPSPDVRYNR